MKLFDLEQAGKPVKLRKGRKSFVKYKIPHSGETLILPCPLKEPQEGMWLIAKSGEVFKSSYRDGDTYNWGNIRDGRCFDSKEDAQGWANAMKGVLGTKDEQVWIDAMRAARL